MNIKVTSAHKICSNLTFAVLSYSVSFGLGPYQVNLVSPLEPDSPRNFELHFPWKAPSYSCRAPCS